ncbi:MAG: hypothetical protein ABIJ97_04265 [Bacteroidota bacterium]
MKTITFLSLILISNLMFSQPSAVYNSITTRSEILKSINLSSDEKKMLSISKQIGSDSELLQEESDMLRLELFKLNEIEKISGDFKDVHSKVLRQIERDCVYELSLRFDIAEYQDMQYDILFDIYSNHYLPLVSMNEKTGQFDVLIKEKNDAEILYNKAMITREKAYFEINSEKCYEKLIKVINDKAIAISQQEELFASWLNIPFKIDRVELNNDLIVNTDILSETISTDNAEKTIATLSETISTDNADKTLAIPEYAEIIIEDTEILYDTIYKIQIGAFINPVDLNEFHGLSPLSVDKTDDKSLTKFMVGEYRSIKVTREALNIIINTTRYDDAFIVAYIQNERVAILKPSLEIVKNYVSENPILLVY